MEPQFPGLFPVAVYTFVAIPITLAILWFIPFTIDFTLGKILRAIVTVWFRRAFK